MTDSQKLGMLLELNIARACAQWRVSHSRTIGQKKRVIPKVYQLVRKIQEVEAS